MDTMTTERLIGLAKKSDRHCVSIYMPTFRAGQEGQQSPIRLKNLLRQAEERLTNNGMRAPEAREFLKPVSNLLAEELFWREQSDGLALFLAPDSFQRFRLPLKFQERLSISQRFHIRPLLSFASFDDRYFVLVIRQNDVRLFRGSRYRLEKIEVKGLPTRMDEALNYDEPQEVGQVHSAMRPAKEKPGKQAAVFHGQGGKPDEMKKSIENFCRAVDEAIQPVLRGAEAPLLLAGSESVVPVFKEVASYPFLQDTVVKGSTDYQTDSELHAAVWPLAEQCLKRAREEALEDYRRAAGRTKTSSEISEVLRSAHEGKVHVLFVADDAKLRGTFDPATFTLEVQETPSEEGEDLIELAAVETLTRRGTVYTLPREKMPNGVEIAALYRYA